MGQHDKELTAYCGLFCGDCIRYKSKASDLASQLLDELGKTKFENYVKVKQRSVKELKTYEEMISALEAINKLKCDIPCRLGGNGCAQPCEIAKCVHSKGIQGCWECNEFEVCDKFEFLKPFHGNAPQNNLKKIKKYGLDTWTATEGACTHGQKKLLRINVPGLTLIALNGIFTKHYLKVIYKLGSITPSHQRERSMLVYSCLRVPARIY